MKKKLKLILLGCVTTLVAAIVIFGWAIFGQHVETGFHLKSVEWLPASASDISFYANHNIGNTHVYEFHILRQDFETLTRDRGWAVKPIEGEVSLDRYTSHLPNGHAERKGPFVVSSSTGLYYEKRFSNNGGISVLYDDASSTAYVSKGSR